MKLNDLTWESCLTCKLLFGSQNMTEAMPAAEVGQQPIQVAVPMPQAAEAGQQPIQMAVPMPQAAEAGQQPIQMAVPMPQAAEAGQQPIQMAVPMPVHQPPGYNAESTTPQPMNQPEAPSLPGMATEREECGAEHAAAIER